ncbi:MAG TPA: glycosyltransferase family 2 protein [Patescibacteria group bacterium]|nr:glycosyltransferase family 2 protein [Patescibacteria group bacterium]
MKKLSVVVSAYNEEKKLHDCLASVKNLADEIIIVDNESSDKTATIAKEFTSHVFTRKNNLMLNVNKNYGFSKATGEWILCLDADERVTPGLEKEIQEVIEREGSVVGYWIPRKNIVFGKWIEHTGWYPDHQLRLFQKGKGKFPQKHVHEMIVVAGETAQLTNPMLHLNYETIQQFVAKMSTIYTPNEAKNLRDKGYRVSYLDVVTLPSKEFMKRFFAQEGYKDGLHGFALSLLMAFYYLLVVLNAWQEEGFQEIQEEKAYQQLGKEMTKIHKELRYWYLTSLLEKTKSPLKKLGMKIRRKML